MRAIAWSAQEANSAHMARMQVAVLLGWCLLSAALSSAAPASWETKLEYGAILCSVDAGSAVCREAELEADVGSRGSVGGTQITQLREAVGAAQQALQEAMPALLGFEPSMDIHIHAAQVPSAGAWAAAEEQSVKDALLAWSTNAIGCTILWHATPLHRLSTLPGAPPSQLTVFGGGSGMDLATGSPGPVLQHLRCGDATWRDWRPKPAEQVSAQRSILLWPSHAQHDPVLGGRALMGPLRNSVAVVAPTSGLVSKALCALAPWQGSCLRHPVLAHTLQIAGRQSWEAARRQAAEKVHGVVTAPPYGWAAPMQLTAAYRDAAQKGNGLSHGGVVHAVESPLASWVALYLPLPLVLATPLLAALRSVLCGGRPLP